MTTLTTDPRSEAAEKARDRCVADGRPDLFVARFHAECHARGLGPGGQTSRFAQRFAADLADHVSRVDRLDRAMAGPDDRVERAAVAARDRCVREGKPDAFVQFYEEALET